LARDAVRSLHHALRNGPQPGPQLTASGNRATIRASRSPAIGRDRAAPPS